MAPKTLQKGPSNLPKLYQNGAKRGRGRSRMGPRGIPARKVFLVTKKSSQHGRKIGFQIEPKSSTNPCQNRSKERCLSRFIFRPILVDFFMENGSKLAPKRDQKSIGRQPTGSKQLCGFVSTNADQDPSQNQWGQSPKTVLSRNRIKQKKPNQCGEHWGTHQDAFFDVGGHQDPD